MDEDLAVLEANRRDLTVNFLERMSQQQAHNRHTGEDWRLIVRMAHDKWQQVVHVSHSPQDKEKQAKGGTVRQMFESKILGRTSHKISSGGGGATRE